MIKFYTLLVSITLIFSNPLLAQAPNGIEELKEKYEGFFELNREYVFLHLNKTSVIPEEDLWLSAYVYNPKSENSNKETANLEVGIYRKNGEHLDIKTLYINNGKGSGYIDLDSEKYPPGEYFLKASTNYMKNFPEDLSFVHPFKVLGKEDPVQKEQISYDLQLLPEGGHLLLESMNTVGVKMINQSGAGAAFESGRVLDSGGKEVTRFRSNRHGLSKFSFIPLPNEEYEVVIESETGEKVSQKLPSAKERGINIVSTVRDDEHLFSIRTNEATLRQIKNTRFFLVVHKDGKIKDMEFEFPEDQVEFNIMMKKNFLFPGVNTVTVFNNDLKPLAERLIFSKDNIRRSSIKATNRGLVGDSVNIGLQAGPVAAGSSLSISVLPSETQAYDPAHNIISAFHLKSYVQGHIDEPFYYFSSGDEGRKEYDLDLLLLSQGWSKYDWKDIFGNPPREIHERIIGYKIEGQLANRDRKKHKNIMVRSDDSGIFEIVNIGTNGVFKEERLFLIDSTKLIFSLVNDKNSKVSIPSLNVSVFPKKEIKNLNREFSFPERTNYKEITSIPGSFSNTEYELDTVQLGSKKFKENSFGSELLIPERGQKITDEIADQYHYITDYIATKGFQVRHIEGKIEIKSLFESTFLGRGGNGMPTGRVAKSNVLLYWNGTSVGSDASFLNRLPSSEVESIIINKRGYGYGMHGVNGVISINTKKGGFVANNAETGKVIIANNGYTLHKEFYVPFYKVLNTAAFKRYGVVDWKPSVLLNGEGKAEFLISKTGPVSLFIEGMNARGGLLSEILTIE